ncbi:hypothetical protein IE53DRAFT_34194 [Violaceomyces palustris]|uniref:Uncharacterized protein n=1 Tax=Violaceomyces palustris TaxID=1673888 RepID=A0ACD0NKZ5_9BASI|nr:hypothetical protein IE53DRAFT_34194 [Violaceomyces palustris]
MNQADPQKKEKKTKKSRKRATVRVRMIESFSFCFFKKNLFLSPSSHPSRMHPRIRSLPLPCFPYQPSPKGDSTTILFSYWGTPYFSFIIELTWTLSVSGIDLPIQTQGNCGLVSRDRSVEVERPTDPTRWQVVHVCGEGSLKNSRLSDRKVAQGVSVLIEGGSVSKGRRGRRSFRSKLSSGLERGRVDVGVGVLCSPREKGEGKG